MKTTYYYRGEVTVCSEDDLQRPVSYSNETGDKKDPLLCGSDCNEVSVKMIKKKVILERLRVLW